MAYENSSKLILEGPANSKYEIKVISPSYNFNGECVNVSELPTSHVIVRKIYETHNSHFLRIHDIGWNNF